MWVAVVRFLVENNYYLPPPVGHGSGFIRWTLPSVGRKEYYMVRVRLCPACLTVSYGVKRGRNYAEK